MRCISLDERAVSTVIGFLLIFSAVVSVTGFLVAAKGRMAQRRAEGMIDVMDEAQERQSQLVSLSYSNKPAGNGGENLSVYLSSYGWQDVVVENLWVNGNSVDEGDFIVYDPVTETVEGHTIPKRKYAAVKIRNLGNYANVNADNYAFTFLTETDIVFSWEVHPG